MASDIKNYKEKIINDYFSSIDLDNIDPSQVKKDLQNALGEIPGIRLNYRNEVIILEDKSKKRIDELESVTIAFTYEQIVTNENNEAVNQVFPCIKTILLK